MKLTPTLFSYLNKPFLKDPAEYFALTLDYSAGTMTWTVADQVLSTAVVGDPGADLTYDLTEYTLTALMAAINGNANYAAVLQPGVNGAIAAIALLDADGTPLTESNGNHLYAFSDLGWSFMDAYAREIQTAANTIPTALAELRLDQADGEWSDFWLAHTLGGIRNQGESDATLDARIISTITQVKCNNEALENLVLAQTGIAVQVVDLDWFEADNTMYTYGGTYWNSGMVTNSSGCGTFPSWTVNGAMVATFGLTIGSDGIPCFGNPANCNPLIDAFAVVFPSFPNEATFDAVMNVINLARAGGTLPIGFYAATMIMTNDAPEVTNNELYNAGPSGTSYAEVAY